jgi:hypothetical protein
MRKPFDHTAGSTSVPGSALNSLRSGVSSSPLWEGYELAGDPSRLFEVLCNLGIELHRSAGNSSVVTASLREALRNVNGCCPEATHDLRRLLEDVTSPRVQLTLEDVRGRVQQIKWRVAHGHPGLTG